MPPLSSSGWGSWAGFQPVTSSDAGPVNKVLGNVGLALQLQAGAGPIRISHLGWRVDLAPDVAVGTVNAPVRWRVCVLNDQLPQDISAFQVQAYPNFAHPEIPAKVGPLASPSVLFDRWLDFSNNDPGLNAVAVVDLADAGPSVASGRTMTVLLIPIIDANLGQTLLGVCNALMYLEVYGTGVSQAGNSAAPQADRSLPRWGVQDNNA